MLTTGKAFVQAPPGVATAAKRRQAITTLKALLADPAAAAKKDGTPTVDASFASEALARLTAPELVNLLDWEHAARNPDTIPWYNTVLLSLPKAFACRFCCAVMFP